MQVKLNLLGTVLLLVSFASCQRVIDVDIANAAQQIVIEGNLTNVNGAQSVVISQSVPYNSANVYPSVSGALVTITDANGRTVTLPESKTPGTYTINYYHGAPLTAYTLNVTVNNTVYTATSVMPVPVNLDSLTVDAEAFGNSTVKTVAVNFVDPAGVPNQYRFVMYINGVQVKQVFVEDDQYSDGRAISALLYQATTLYSGNTVQVEMQCIDVNMYNYWFTLSNQGGNTPADSATPANPPSNLNNNALGYFSAHTTQKKTVVIP